MKTFFTILASVLITFAVLAGAYYWLPLGFLEPSPMIGTTITTIAGSDTLSASRTTINNNFTALNNGKIEVSTTSLGLLTSAANLSTVGTITTGVWTGTAIAVNKGGTGTTSPSQFLVVLGNGANGLTIASSTGTSGQSLISNGPGAYPSWQSSSVNQASNYQWTGWHVFSSTASSTASTSVSYLSTNNLSALTINATTTVWDNLQVNGILKHNHMVCSGNYTTAVANGWSSVAIACGFKPSVIHFKGFYSSSWSVGESGINGYHSALYNLESGGSKTMATSSIVINSGSGDYIIGTSTFTNTGFNINFKSNGITPTALFYTAY